jgi:hypothetical protein
VSAQTEVSAADRAMRPSVGSYKFAYVAIPKTCPVRAGMEKPYSALTAVLSKFDVTLPPHLRAQHMHLDPDFDYLTYGDQGERAKQLRSKLSQRDRIVFYSGIKDAHNRSRLVYAIIGMFVVDDICTGNKRAGISLSLYIQ